MTGPVQNRVKIDKGVLKSELPEAPGVYLFKDISGNIIYVGKAKNLKKRVLSYFKSGSDISHKTIHMMDKARGLDYILTDTENEAFILESSLIKGHMPKYNVILRDDKQYPCLCLDINETYPRLTIVRKIKKDGSVYFGPFSSSHSVRSSLRSIDRIFRLRKCKTGVLKKRSRSCLNFQMGRCLGPCSHEVPLAQYREIVEQVRLFLEGRNKELLRRLDKEMRRLAEIESFEEAARVRDQISALKRTVEKQHVVSSRLEDLDIIGLACRDNTYQLVIQFIRKGYLVGSRDYFFKDTAASRSEVIEAFIKQYYTRSIFIPKDILVSDHLEEFDALGKWISEIAGKKVSIKRPRKGEKLGMINMAISNAEDALLRVEQHTKEDILEHARDVLKLKKTPEMIECMDISNLQGIMAVGTVVSFLKGKPYKAGYRNYRIKGVEGINDYGMMSEMVKRHLSGGGTPDLLVLDGGRGHLLTVDKIINQLDIEVCPDIVSIAKGDERKGQRADKIYLKDRKNPLILRQDHPVLLLLMHIRDEAHRRAISYHRRVRNKEMKKSLLDLIPGIGPEKKKLLLNKFGDINAISRARPEELVLIKGISESLAQSIAGFFLKEIKKTVDNER